MRVGIVCPYSLDAPGGVQAHAIELARSLRTLGHEARVLAPASPGTHVPDVVDPAGRSIGLPFNGAVARVRLSPGSARLVRSWLDQGRPDVLHVHEPLSPSISLQAMRAFDGPTVATFHASLGRPRLLAPVTPVTRRLLAGLDARIAVSREASRTARVWLGNGVGAPTIIPNGVDVGRFAAARPRPEWLGTIEAPVLAFLGRLDEPRKGLPVLLRAHARLRATHPGARLLVAGRGGAAAVRGAGPGVEHLGELSETDKEALLASVDAYVAPQTHGESFGIVLVEAMAAGAAVVASDLPAFRAVLDAGRLGRLAPVGDDAALALALAAELAARPRESARARLAREAAGQYDWDVVTRRILEVYARAYRGRAPAAGRGE